MIKIICSLLILPFSARPLDSTLTFEDLMLEGPEGNKYAAMSILKKLDNVDMVSNIADFDKKAITFDDIISTSKSLL